MNKKNTSRKGFTLTELVVVLAVLAVASGMVVTFSTMMHSAQGISNARHEALQDVLTVEKLVEGFIEGQPTSSSVYVKEIKCDTDDCKGDECTECTEALCFVTNGAAANKEELGNEYIRFVYGTFPYLVIFTESSSDDGSSAFFDGIKKITFELDGANSEGIYTNTDVLYYCTITYTVATTDYDYTFCVNPYVGETVTGGTVGGN